MQIHLRAETLATKTANCVNCSRSIVHNVCTVLHLGGRGWIVEQGSRRDVQIEAQESRGIGEQELFLERPTKPQVQD
jgi:hypothetical protein